VKTARDRSARASIRELEERLQLGKSTITELVTRNEERGLVRRELDRNRRGAIVVRLTPAGNRRLAATVAANGDERSRLLDALAPLQVEDVNGDEQAIPR
jgi:DNA-binding MarR family transcriptional regulator